jgi:hypothetical protein
MPSLKHFCRLNHLHHLTANTYRKVRIFDSDRYSTTCTITHKAGFGRAAWWLAMVKLEALLPEVRFCSGYGPDSLSRNCEGSHWDKRGADIQTNVCATRGGGWGGGI